MNLIRSIISVFLVILAAVSVAGWIWAGNGQRPPNFSVAGARFVLALCGLGAVGGLWLLWNVNPARMNAE